MGPFNLFTHFVGANPCTSFNTEVSLPTIHPTAFIGPFSSVIGDVTIDKNVFIACNATLRADEGTPFFIGENTNIQDGVILHGLNEGRVFVDGEKYSIFIGKNVTCGHGCLIHGPCVLGKDVFIGFNSIVFNAIICDGSYISAGAVVTGGIRIPPNCFVPTKTLIDTQEKADLLDPVPKSSTEFAKEVQHINQEFPSSYSLMFGSIRCSCGLACDPEHLKDLYL